MTFGKILKAISDLHSITIDSIIFHDVLDTDNAEAVAIACRKSSFIDSVTVKRKQLSVKATVVQDLSYINIYVNKSVYNNTDSYAYANFPAEVIASAYGKIFGVAARYANQPAVVLSKRFSCMFDDEQINALDYYDYATNTLHLFSIAIAEKDVADIAKG